MEIEREDATAAAEERGRLRHLCCLLHTYTQDTRGVGGWGEGALRTQPGTPNIDTSRYAGGGTGRERERGCGKRFTRPFPPGAPSRKHPAFPPLLREGGRVEEEGGRRDAGNATPPCPLFCRPLLSPPSDPPFDFAFSKPLPILTGRHNPPSPAFSSALSSPRFQPTSPLLGKRSGEAGGLRTEEGRGGVASAPTHVWRRGDMLCCCCCDFEL